MNDNPHTKEAMDASLGKSQMQRRTSHMAVKNMAEKLSAKRLAKANLQNPNE